MMMFVKCLTSVFFLTLGVGLLQAQQSNKDTGKERIGRIKTTVYYGTNGQLGKLGKKAQAVPEPELQKLQNIEKMKFSNYRVLGQDTRSVLRSYENWASPLKPSEEIMLSFESRGSNGEGLKLDLELWQHKRKVMKTDPLIYKGKPLLILGPKWRGGKLIIAVELIELSNSP